MSAATGVIRRLGSSGKLRIGDVEATVRVAKQPHLVPRLYNPAALGSGELSQSLLSHVRWMVQKDGLGQDMFLIGPPGPLRRRLALWFCELTGKEAEYLSLSRDTTDSDLKQRREIVNGNVVYVDAAPVRAAIEGRVLLLDGIEKAERNVLPTLNNLLENREMGLPDGRFLVHPTRYDALAASMSAEELAAKKLVRVHPNFRVVGLGLPVPAYPGFPLDPPLRSRFQSRFVDNGTLGEQLDALGALSPATPATTWHQLLNLAKTIDGLVEVAPTATSKLHPLPQSAISGIATVLSRIGSGQSMDALLRRYYPYHLFELEPPYSDAVDAMLRQLRFTGGAQAGPVLTGTTLHTTTVSPVGKPVHHIQATLSAGSGVEQLNITGGGPPVVWPAELVISDEHRSALAAMVQDHAVGKDLCIVGPKGSGKSVLAGLFADSLGYTPNVIHMYKDMTARDLLQRRHTDEHGNTTWVTTPLVQAALDGQLTVLDGVHRVPHDTLSVLRQLVYDREVALFDGTRLVGADRYESMIKEIGEDAVKAAGVRAIHPAFRVVALGNPPTPTNRWLTAEIMDMFAFHSVPTSSAGEQVAILSRLFPDADASSVASLCSFARSLQDLQAHADGSINKAATPTAGSRRSPDAVSLSTRQLVRLGRRLRLYPEDLPDTVRRTCLTNFMPVAVRESFEQLLAESGVVTRPVDDSEFRLRMSEPASAIPAPAVVPALEIKRSATELAIGAVRMPVAEPAHPELVPNVLFYNIPMHVARLQALLKDLVSGEKNMLLIGNQGTGKNKLADRLLQLLGWEREYIQLHRDTTVQSLTVAPTLVNGVVVWEDSALVKAVRDGRVLMVDEADKAPLEVVCILKGLLEDGQMHLSDGRRILSPRLAARLPDASNVIPIHPNFRMLVLANRPGFPFLGNDFFRECGDVFSCHVIDNPDVLSQVELLASYAPNLERRLLSQLASAWQELGQLVNDGLLAYPYSARELVNVVKHLQAYPNDSLLTALDNVLGFDNVDAQLMTSLTEVFNRHGIPVQPPSSRRFSISLTQPTALRPLSHPVGIRLSDPQPDKVHVRALPLSSRNAGYQFATRKTVPLNSVAGRIGSFSEELYTSHLDLGGGRATGVAALPDGSVHVLSSEPSNLYSLRAGDSAADHVQVTQMDFLPTSLPCGIAPAPSTSEVLIHAFPCGLYYKYHPQSGEARMVELPAEFFGRQVTLTMQRMAWTELRKQNTAHPMIASHQWAAQDKLVLYRQLSSQVLIIDTLKHVSRLLDLPPHLHVHSAHLLSNGQLVIQTPSGGWFVVQYDADSRVPTSGSIRRVRIDDSPATLPGVLNLLAPIAPNETLAVVEMPAMPGQKPSDERVTAPSRAVFQVHSSSDKDATSWSMGVHCTGPPAGGIPTGVLRLANGPVEYCPEAGAIAGVVTLGSARGMEHPTIADVVDAWQGVEWIDTQTNSFRLINATAPEAASRAATGRSASNAPAGPSPIVGVAGLPGRNLAVTHTDGSIRVWQMDANKTEQDLSDWMHLFGAGSQEPLTLRFTDDDAMKSVATNDADVETDDQPATNGGVVGGGNDGGGGGGGAGGGDEDDVGGMGGSGSGGVGGSGSGGVGGQGSGGQGSGGGGSGTGGGGGGGSSGSRSNGWGGFSPSALPSGAAATQSPSAAAAAAIAQQAADRVAAILSSQRQSGSFDDQAANSAYKEYIDRVGKQVIQLRVILEAAEAKEKEREWLKNQIQGELDDMKLIDGVTGDPSVFKRRGTPDQQLGLFQHKPVCSSLLSYNLVMRGMRQKRLHFALDLSGSMTRGNSWDHRLDRCVDVAVLVMEALHGFEHKFVYSMSGHSGATAEVPLVEYGRPPRNAAERLQVVQSMYAHSRSCPSGDNSLAAAQAAVAEVVKEEADDYFVFLLSDANLGRYNVSPQQIGAVLRKDERVNAYALFIAEPSAAAWLTKELPFGHGFVCLDTASLPTTFKEILTHAAARSTD